MSLIKPAVWLIGALVGISLNLAPIPKTANDATHDFSFQDPLEPILYELAKCESGGRDDIHILDSNDKYSYGRFQFQLTTFRGFGIQYGILPKEITEAEAEMLIYDQELQTKVASAMIKDGLLHLHWVNCFKKMSPELTQLYHDLTI